MTFTSDQYSQIARGYDKAAADPLVPKDMRGEFVRKAEWFHYLAARENKTRANGGSDETCSKRRKKPVGALLTTLWLTGAALYLISTLLFTNAVGLFGDDETASVGKASQPLGRSLPIARVEDKEKTVETADQIGPAADRRHAVSPNQPSYEAPGLSLPPAAQLDDLNAPRSPAPAQEESIPPDRLRSSATEVLKTTAAANIRNGPSIRSKVIGSATLGAELQVKARKDGWVQFVDPSSGHSGWIHSSLVASSRPEDARRPSETRLVDDSASAAENAQTVKRRVKQKPNALVPNRARRLSRPPPAGRQPTYADLPDDQEFLPDRSHERMGFFARRRMLREGLMSPGFLPPR